MSLDIDTLTLRVGDGTSNPPKIYTNKTSNLSNLLPSVYWSAVVNTPTTLAGYGITDSQPYSSTLAKIASLNTSGVEGVLELDINGNFNIVEIGNIETLTGILAIDQGGTGASTAIQALINLGAPTLLSNNFVGIQTIAADSPQALTLTSTSTSALIAPAISVERHAVVPNHSDLSQIRFTAFDSSTNTQEAFKIIVTIDDHSYTNFTSHASFYTHSATGSDLALGLYSNGMVLGSGNTPQGVGTLNATDLLINGVSVSESFIPANATFNINSITGLPNLLNGLISTSGGTLTGPLYLYADPTRNNECATKFYVDSKVGIYTATPPVGDTPPTNPIANQLWWSSLDGNLYIYYGGTWVSAFAVPSLFLGAATDNIPPLQIYVTNIPNPVPISLTGAQVWNSGLILGNGYTQITVSVMLTAAGLLTIQRYVDQLGQVEQGAPTIANLGPLQTSVVNIGDGIPWGSVNITISNETESVSGLSSFNILLNV